MDPLAAAIDNDNNDDDGELAGDADKAAGDGAGEMRPVLAQRAQCPLPVSILPVLYFCQYFVLPKFGTGYLVLYLYPFIYSVFYPFQILCIFIFSDTLWSTLWLSTTCLSTS